MLRNSPQLQSTPANRTMFEAIERGDPASVLDAIAAGADLNFWSLKHGGTALMFAAGQGSAECARALIPACDPARAHGCFKEDALMAAAYSGSAACIRELLPHSNPKAQNYQGMSALMIACNHEHLDCARALAPFSDLSQTDAYKRTALHLASRSPFPELAAALLDGSDTEARDAFGRTPLLNAVFHGSRACAELLLPLSENSEDNDGKTAADLADDKALRELAEHIRGHFRTREDRAKISESALLPGARRPQPKL